MAIAFIRGTLTRDPYFKAGEETAFAAGTVKETYKDRSGEERIGGYHDVVAFGDEAQAFALYEEGDEIEVKASVRYRADKRFVNVNDETKNPFTAQFVIMTILSKRESSDEDPFDGA